MEVRIKRLEKEDAREAAALEELSFGKEGWSEQDFLDTLKLDYAYYLCACSREELIGLAGARLIAGEAYISNVSVHPGLRREGIGLRLMEELMELLLANGATAYTLEVRSLNRAATGLYEKLGFVREGIRRNFYTSPEDDAIIMWKR